MTGALTTLLLAGRAHAEPTAEDRAQATLLFTQGTDLLTAGDVQAACPKLEEAERIAPGFGIELNLGDCYEKSTRLASAWAMFQKAASNARAAGKQERETNATTRAKALEPRLSYLAVEVAPASRIPGLAITRDDKPLGPGQWGAALPIDSGSHRLAATAAGHFAWKEDIVVAEGARVARPVPRLADAPIAAVVQPIPPQDVHERSQASRTIGFVALGVGAAGIVTGTVLVVLAKGKHDDSNPRCPQPNQCDAAGVAGRDSAVDLANGASVGYAIGAAGLVASAVLLFVVPALAGSSRTALAVMPRGAGALTTF